MSGCSFDVIEKVDLSFSLAMCFEFHVVWVMPWALFLLGSLVGYHPTKCFAKNYHPRDLFNNNNNKNKKNTWFS